jgi:hypothetical protein
MFDSYVYTRYVLVRWHEVGERGERRLGYKYIYCLFLNTKVHVVWWLAPNFWSRGVWVRVLTPVGVVFAQVAHIRFLID